MTDDKIRSALWDLFKLPYLKLSSHEEDIIDGILFSREGKNVRPNYNSLSKQRRDRALEIVAKYLRTDPCGT